MPCYSKYEVDGNTFLCGKLGKHCNASGCNWVSEYLCDYPIDDDKTCDRPLCDEHAYEVAPDLHYCAAHYNELEKFKGHVYGINELKNVVPFKRV